MKTTTVSSKTEVVLPERLRDELETRRRPQPGGRGWRGSVTGARTLDDHLREHAEEVAGERLP